ncbi:uncharacterized protein LOC110706629 [Chenopodium quinoa]|uniref:uncharacterized protein LOC110706629 n=1 Tax=Chenopodium quinoa TaxID=63459 RepID=UPI000B7794ED|nr:uncharacterized protein LOC110706629 [Chenopodium quinoa]XP_021740267.1 uncharacterized protein LOC110706629 [Chenopodium quinoa]XP_021740268.1 uncharacterized protein LOC110706629 [Chenopodium quinoa]
METMVHNTPIPSGYVKVGIDYDVEENTPLPMSIEGVDDVIKDAIGSIVLWPIELIVLDKVMNPLEEKDKEEGQDKQGKDKLGKESIKPRPVTCLRKRKPQSLENSEKLVKVHEGHEKCSNANNEPIESQKVNHPSNRTPTSPPIQSQKEMKSFDNEKEKVDRCIEALVIANAQPEMIMFFKYAAKIALDEQIRVPIDIGIRSQCKEVYLVTQFQKGDMKKIKDHNMKRSHYMVDVFKDNASKGKNFLAPYNAGMHWVLCAIDPFNNIVYYFDSLHNEEEIGTRKGVSEDLREIIDVALFQFRSEMEIATKLKMDTKWKTIKCPRQSNGVDCGYYVMRYMKEIISHKRTKIPESYLAGCQFSHYDETQLDDVRLEWVRYVFQHI